LGMSQAELAKYVNVTFQQIQKYEKGKDTLGASKLYIISKVLKVNVSDFFYDNITPTYVQYDSTNQEVIDLVTFYKKIESPNIKKNILRLIRSISEEYMNVYI
jgi:transcriptional regulator with XRE-family HTH domain